MPMGSEEGLSPADVDGAAPSCGLDSQLSHVQTEAALISDGVSSVGGRALPQRLRGLSTGGLNTGNISSPALPVLPPLATEAGPEQSLGGANHGTRITIASPSRPLKSRRWQALTMALARKFGKTTLPHLAAGQPAEDSKPGDGSSVC